MKDKSIQNQKGKKKEEISNLDSRKSFVFLGLILVIAFIAYLPSLKNGFVWDDNDYVRNNLLIYKFSLKDIFSTFTMANYHPITIFAFAVEYKIFGPNESAFHLVNILIHLSNVVLVFFAIRLLSQNAVTALVASLLFAVHPMHVESVTWVSGLKDLLYTFFFLAAYICYLKFLREKKNGYYFFALVLFIFSLLSKAMAVVLPVVLILTDYFLGEKINGRSMLRKIPFFILSIVTGIVAIHAQKEMGATDLTVFPLGQRIVFACYGFVMYIIKLAFPFSLSALYGYPMAVGEPMPGTYYLFILLFLAVIGIVIYSLRQTNKIFFGIGFFAITLFLVLQLMPVGSAVMADRYSYLSSVGIFYLAGEGINLLWNKRKNQETLRYSVPVLIVIFTAFYSYKTYAQSRIWKDGITLWNSVIERNPLSPTAYLNRATDYSNENNTTAALADYNKAIELKPDYAEALNNRAVLFIKTNQYNEALADLNKAIGLDPNLPLSYNNRGLVYMYTKKNPEALESYNKSIALDSKNLEAYFNRGILLNSEKRPGDALNDFNTVIRLNPSYIDAYYYRGLCFIGLGQFDNALRDFSTTIESRPNYISAYEYRSAILLNARKFPEALNDLDFILSRNPDAKTYLNRGSVYGEMKKYPEALADYNSSISLQPDLAKAYFNKAIIEQTVGVTDSACIHLRRAIELGFEKAKAKYKEICK